jgi:hypothetical protein
MQQKTITISLGATKTYLISDTVRIVQPRILTETELETLTEQLTSEGYTVNIIDETRDEGM